MGNMMEVLLNLTSAKVDKIERALERNWITLLILAAVSLALVFDVGDVSKLLAGYFNMDEYNEKPVGIIVPAALLYFFMRLGYLVTSFIRARRLHDSLLNQYVGEQFDHDTLAPLRETTNFFEVFYSTKSFGGGHGPVVVAFFTVSTLVISAAQAAALFLPVRAYGFSGWVAGLLACYVAALFVLHGAFWKAQRKHPGTTPVVVSIILLVVVWLFVFYAFASLKPTG